MATFALPLSGCGKGSEDDTIVLRVANWEEYIDQGEWDEEDAVELEDGTIICPQDKMINDFETWYYENYGKKVKVSYSTFGTNEELYNQLTLGDVYDLVCPSEYMIMKLMTKGMLEPYSDQFYDDTDENNYYTRGVSNYIHSVFDNLNIQNERLSKYAAGYMWGTLGLIYNPEYITEEEASHWDLLMNNKFSKQVTVKDSVRDAYFAANNIYQQDKLSRLVKNHASTSALSAVVNDTSVETVNQVENILSKIKDNVYAFETDSGKADIATGKIIACMQWSGDAVYTMDQVEEDVALNYTVPEGAGNLWFDGWCMLKSGIDGDDDRKQAAEAFVNFVSRPDNAIRNMEYIGYTSVISGGDSDLIYQYIDSSYGVDEEDSTETEELVDYNLDYFFKTSDESSEDESKYTIHTTKQQARAQLFAQYPTEEVISRCVVMACFNEEENKRINQKWIDIRCFDLKWP
jgi:spermidine/putrescine transport system substrate-binding protein